MLKHISGRVVILDDKKCGNSKSAIDHVIKQLHICYGVNYPEKRGQVRPQEQKHEMMSDDISFGDRHDIEIQEDLDSESGKDSEDSHFQFDDEEEIKNSEQGERKSSDYVSSLRNPSMGEGGHRVSYVEGGDSLQMN